MVSKPANSLNLSGSAGVVSWDGTATVSTSAVTQYGVLLGGASNAITSQALTNGQLLIGNTGNAPTAATLTQGANIVITNAAGAVTIAASGTNYGYTSTNVQIFTASGTYTPTAGMVCCQIEVVGGGGGGGGAAATSTSQLAGGGGGGGGGYARSVVTAATIGASQVVTVGLAGTAGTAGANPGGQGGTTSVGAIISATGGFGGAGGAVGAPCANIGGAGGVGSGGNFNTTGSPGGSSFGLQMSTSLVVSGYGGSTLFGGGALPITHTSGAGNAATSYGGGGGGAGNSISQSAVAGGAGYAGIVIITEYIAASTLTLALPWTNVTGTTQAMVVNNGYIANNAGLVTLTLPVTAALGALLAVAGLGAGGWKIAQNAGQYINFGSVVTTTGITGYLASTNAFDTVFLLCTVANTSWSILQSQGNITYN